MTTNSGEPPTDAALVQLGVLGRPFQLDGGLRFHPLGPAEALAVERLERLTIEGRGALGVRRRRRSGSGWILYLEGIRTRETAQELVRAAVFAAPEALPDVRAEGLYFADLLLGLPVWVDGSLFGQVSEVFLNGPQDLLRVAPEGAEGDGVLVPLRAPYVTIEAAAVRIDDPPAGLLEPARGGP